MQLPIFISIFTLNTSLRRPFLPAWMAATATVLLLLLTLITTANSAQIHTGSISPNFTTSHFLLIDNSGDFLRSLNNTYTAAIAAAKPSSPSFYLLIYHSASHTVVWTANRNAPISTSGQFRLTPTGITIHGDTGDLVWSTPAINSTVDSLQLLDSGNLILTNRVNKTLWQSFDYPTDTIVTGQRFPVGASLISSSPEEFSDGDYEFKLTSGDGLFQWRNLTYYRLLFDPKSVVNSKIPINYLIINGTGFYLVGDEGLAIQILITPASSNSDYRILKMLNDGRLVVSRYSYLKNNWATDFTSPEDSCRSPYRCGKLGICSGGSCSCPPGFRINPVTNFGCVLFNNSLSLPESCNENDKETLKKSNSSENFEYIHLGKGMRYFPIEFTEPVETGVDSDSSNCEEICSERCLCLGFFHQNQSGKCYLIENYLGSIVFTKTENKLGFMFVKARSSSPPSENQENVSNSNFPVFGFVLIPSSAFVFVLLISILGIWIRRRIKNKKLGLGLKNRGDGFNSDDLEMFLIAGLPVRFEYEDLVIATVNFTTPIGSGGFGTVYKGVLGDKTVVAVKKINALGAQGKKEFGTEIAIIGNIHHVNLVKLKGFCAHGRERFLVYEYMSRGSLDRTLFSSGPPMEWQERVEIAVGAARGLAYLHSGCEHKIIHCDVKPENILLNDSMQVKISDFGLSKLLSPEQSGLFTTMRGTRGYLAPEWLTNTAITDRTDVYSYGMVLLELIQGRKNCVQVVSPLSHGSGNPGTSTTSGQSSVSSGSHTHPRTRSYYFPLQALEMHEEGRYLDLVEPRIASRVTNDEAEKLVKVALCCLHEYPSMRPTMENVVAMLEGTIPVTEPRLESLNFLRFYGRRFTEPSTVVTGAEVEVPSGFMVPNVYSSSPSAAPDSFSYMSSQQVSGPR